MRLEEQNILFFTRTMALGGTENVILQMCEVLIPRVKKIVVCSSGGVNEQVLREMGIKHYTIPDIENKSLRNLLHVTKTVQKIIIDEKITVIHTHHRMAAMYVQFLRRRNQFLFLATVHGEFFNKKILTRFSYRDARMIACGEKVKRNLVDVFRIDEKRITVIRNAVKYETEYKEIDILSKCRENGEFLYCYIGRLSEEKGLDYLIKAIAILKESTGKYRLIIVGTGNDQSKIEEESRRLKVDDKIIYLGYRNDAQNVMKQIDVVVLPSLTEGLPLTPMEAFANGKTVIATNVGGTGEIVQHMYNGILVEPKNETDLGRAMLSIYKDAELRKRLSANALTSYQERFGYSFFENSVLEFYEAVI